MEHHQYEIATKDMFPYLKTAYEWYTLSAFSEGSYFQFEAFSITNFSIGVFSENAEEEE